jgi:hypothetical protein
MIFLRLPPVGPASGALRNDAQELSYQELSYQELSYQELRYHRFTRG